MELNWETHRLTKLEFLPVKGNKSPETSFFTKIIALSWTAECFHIILCSNTSHQPSATTETDWWLRNRKQQKALKEISSKYGYLTPYTKGLKNDFFLFSSTDYCTQNYPYLSRFLYSKQASNKTVKGTSDVGPSPSAPTQGEVTSDGRYLSVSA